MSSTPEPAALHAMDPTRRFSSRAADYAAHRPTYPPDAIDALLDGLGDPAGLFAADVGAGTGISARLLAGRGVSVVAVEPNAAMRAGAAPHPLVRWAEGTAERTGLAAASVGLVVAAQAFHWFRPREALAEFRRILKPAGRVALVWNERDNDDPATLAYTAAVREASGDHPAERRMFDAAAFDAFGFFGPLRSAARVPNRQRVDAAGLLGRATSASYVPTCGPAFDRLTHRMAEAHRNHADDRGVFTLRYVTTVWVLE